MFAAFWIQKHYTLALELVEQHFFDLELFLTVTHLMMGFRVPHFLAPVLVIPLLALDFWEPF